jgi:hypothetical protein
MEVKSLRFLAEVCDCAKAPEGWRNPRTGVFRMTLKQREAFWIAAGLYRF